MEPVHLTSAGVSVPEQMHFHTADPYHAQDYLNRSCVISTRLSASARAFDFSLSHIRAHHILIVSLQGAHILTSRMAVDDTTFLFPVDGVHNLRSHQKSVIFDHSVTGSVLTGEYDRHYNLHHGRIILPIILLSRL